MTSRERLLAVLRHEIPDRIPVSAYDMTGWHKDSEKVKNPGNGMDTYIHDEILCTFMTGWWNREASYMPLMEYIRENTDCMYMTEVPMVNRYVRDHTYVDQYKKENSTYTRITITTPKGDLTQLFRVDKGVYTGWQVEHLIKNDDDIEKYLSIPDDLLPVETSHLKSQDDFIGDNGILIIDIADPLAVVFDLFKFDDFTVKGYTDEKTITRMLDKVFEQQMFFLEDMLKKGAGPLFRIIGGEVATPPYLTPDHFHKYVCKYDKEMVRLIHKYGKFARMHCHGRIGKVLDHMIEIGVDAIDPVEAPPSGDIDLAEVKKRYGDKLCLMGNIQLRDLELLPEDEMRKVIIKCIEDGKPGGGFVVMPTATPINVPLSPITERNFRLLIDTVLECGRY